MASMDFKQLQQYITTTVNEYLHTVLADLVWQFCYSGRDIDDCTLRGLFVGSDFSPASIINEFAVILYWGHSYEYMDSIEISCLHIIGKYQRENISAVVKIKLAAIDCIGSWFHELSRKMIDMLPPTPSNFSTLTGPRAWHGIEKMIYLEGTRELQEPCYHILLNWWTSDQGILNFADGSYQESGGGDLKLTRGQYFAWWAGVINEGRPYCVMQWYYTGPKTRHIYAEVIGWSTIAERGHICGYIRRHVYSNPIIAILR